MTSGNARRGFQPILRNGQKFGERHEVLSLALLSALLASQPHDLPWVAAGILCHHRDLQELRRRYDRVIWSWIFRMIVSRLQDFLTMKL